MGINSWTLAHSLLCAVGPCAAACSHMSENAHRDELELHMHCPFGHLHMFLSLNPLCPSTCSSCGKRSSLIGVATSKREWLLMAVPCISVSKRSWLLASAAMEPRWWSALTELDLGSRSHRQVSSVSARVGTDLSVDEPQWPVHPFGKGHDMCLCSSIGIKDKEEMLTLHLCLLPGEARRCSCSA